MKNIKINYRIIFWSALCFFALIIAADQYVRHPAEINAFLRFDERQIIGHSKAEIIEKYGEFDRVRLVKRDKEPTHSNYIKYSGLYRLTKARDWQPTSGIYYYYWIFFSEDDIALTTEIAIPPDEQ